MNNCQGFRLSSLPLFQVAFLFGAGGPLLAAPGGGEVTAGAAVIAGTPGNTTIHQTTDRAIIHWNDFSIGAGEIVNFLMPSSGSAVLNRVTGNAISTLDGTLSSNGQVYLINPHGIVIGSSGVVTTQGFVAGTGAVLDGEFLEGRRMTVSGANGRIVNSGKIDAGQGDVVLMAREIDQRGTVTAGGSVALGAGTEVTLSRAGDGGMSVRVTGEGKIDQSGTIEAARAELRAAGGNPYSLAINHDGVTRATGAVKSGGKVILTGGSGGVRIGGKVRAAGGQVDISGRRVEIAATAEVDVSGEKGGGTIRVGGGFGGKSPEDLGHAEEVEVKEGARLSADALGSGDGGRIAVWSDHSTEFRGGLSVQGAGASGAGGFAEVSSAGVLDFTGTALLGGSGGMNGTLLLDPTDLTLGAAQAGSIVGSLASGNVVVATSGSGAGAGNLTINSAISYTSANDLFFLAHGSVRVNASVRNAGSGDITAIAGWNGTTGADGSVSGAAFLANAATYGNNSGSIFIGSATQATATSFGSRDGDLFLGGSGLTLAGGNTANAYAQVGWNAIDQGAAHTVTGDISLALKGNLVLQGGTAARTSAQIGHGGNTPSSTTIDGTFAGSINATVAGSTTLAGGNFEIAGAQIGHGGYLSRGAKSGDLTLDTGSLVMLSGNANYSATQIGHGGNLGTLDQNYSGAIAVHSLGNIAMTAGGAFDAFSQIGHGGRGTAGTSPVSFSGEIEVTGLDLTMAMVSTGTSHVQIGHGGDRAAGNHGGNITVAVRDLSMLARGQHSYMFLGHGGSDGDLTGNVDVQARDITLWANNNNGTHSQIGHGTAKGNMTGTTTVNARDIVLRAGGAWARIGMGYQGGNGTANATGDIVVNGRNLTMIGGNSYSNPAKIGHGRIDPGIMQGDITVTMTGETSLERNPNGSSASISHITTTQTNGIINSDWSLTTGTLDDSSTATASGVILNSDLASSLADPGQYGNATLTATGLNGNDGQLTINSNYTGYSPYTVTFASTRDFTVNATTTFQANWVGNIRLLFGQTAGGTLRLNAAVSTPGSGNASITGGLFDDTVILGISGTVESTIDGGGGVNTLTGDANANAFVVNGSNSGTLAGRTSGWLNFQNLSGEGGNDTFAFNIAGSLGGTISGGTGSNTLTGDGDGNVFFITGNGSGSLEGKVAAWNGMQDVTGGSGTDRFVFTPDGRVSGSLNGGIGSDILQMADGGGTISIAGSNSGSYLGVRGWSSIENLVGGSGDDIFSFSNSGLLSGTVTGGGGSDLIRGDTNGNVFAITSAYAGTLEGKLSSWREIESLEGGSGTDILTGSQLGSEFVISGSNAGSITGFLQSWSAIENIAGGNGDDLFRFSGTGSLSGSLAGNSGRNRVVAPDSDSVFQVYSANSGLLVDRVGFEWTGIRDLTGGAGNDTFRFYAASSAGNIDGGGGINTLQGSNFGEDFGITGANSGTMSGKIGGWSNISILLGGDGSDVFLFEGGSLLGGSIIGGAGLNRLGVSGTAANTYVVSGANSGSTVGLVDTWSGIRAITAGDGDDRFEIMSDGSLTGPLDGGGGTDTLAAMEAPAYFQIVGENFGHLDGKLTGWSNIENLEGSGGDDRFLVGGFVDMISGLGGSDKIESYRVSSDFLIDGNSSGSLGNMLWQGIENLAGSSGRDVFRFIGAGRIDGLLDGGAGNNQLDYSQADSAVEVDLKAGTATRTGGIAGFAEVIGSAFADLLRGGPLTRLLDGGGGDDVFEIRSGDQDGAAVTVIGGGGSDQLTFDFSDSLLDSTVRIMDGGFSRGWNTGGELHSFEGISLVRVLAGGGSERVETAGFAFAQELDGGAGENTLVLDGSGAGIVNPASPVVIGGSGLITHLNFGTVDVMNAATPDEVRAIIAASSSSFDLAERAELLRFLWFLQSTVQADRRGGFVHLGRDGQPLEVMAGSLGDR